MVSISEKAEVITVLQKEMEQLLSLAKQLSEDSIAHYETFARNMEELSNKQYANLQKIIALEESIERIMHGKV